MSAAGVPLLAVILGASLAGSVLSLAIAALVAFRVQAKWIPTLVSYAVGALLGAVFLDLVPHIFEETKNPDRAAACMLFGLLAFFVLEKLLLWRHHHGSEGHGEPQEDDHGAHAQDHGHAHDHGDGRAGWIIIAGDAFHNFTDGIIIAGAFLADMRLGVVTSLAIIAHEIPHEIGDFLVLLHSGFTKRRALAANLLSGLATLLGATIAYFALRAVSGWIPEILAVSAASMIYVAVADLIPSLHKRSALDESLLQVAFIVLGIATIWATAVLLGHGH